MHGQRSQDQSTQITTTSKMIKECKEMLNRAGRNNEITLVWVPGLSDVEGNERVVELARQGSATAMFGPEPFIPIPQSLCDDARRKWVQSEQVHA